MFPLVSAIRVLEIEPGTFDADIECEMSPWYDGDQGYTALSYVWGDDPPTKSMWVDRELVMIRKNLDNAIRYIRDENEPVRLWVDAICINQQDLSERTSQVEMMSEIYQQAQGLFVFLGEGGEDLSTLFAFIQDINDDIPIDEVIEKADILRVLDQFWQLLQMPWWSRIWIIQEFAYADASPTFVYGHRKFSASWLWYGFGVLRDVLLRDLYCFVQISDGNPQMDDSALPLWRGAGSVSQGLHILRSRQQLFHWRQQPVPATHKVSELLKDTQFYLATEPRDRLFALHSLMMDPLRACFLPDYHQSIRAVNIRMTAYLLCIEGWAEMYNYFPTTADATLPSWVPNFSTNRERDKWFRIWDNNNSPGQHSWKLDCWAEGAILGIRGVHCGTVTEIPGLNWKGKNMTASLQDSSAASCSQSGDGCHDVNNFQTFPQILAETDSPIRLKMTSPGCSTWLISSKLVHEARRLPRIKAYFHEVLAKLRRRRLTKNSYGQLDFGRLDFRGHLTAPMIEERLRMTPKWEDSGIDEAWIDVKMQLGKSSDRWPDEHFQGLVFTTDTGFTGLCPLQTQIGDKLVVLKGMPTTFLARADESDGQYMLIGPVRVTKDTLIGILTEATHKSNLETFYFK